MIDSVNKMCYQFFHKRFKMDYDFDKIMISEFITKPSFKTKIFQLWIVDNLWAITKVVYFLLD